MVGGVLSRHLDTAIAGQASPATASVVEFIKVSSRRYRYPAVRLAVIAIGRADAYSTTSGPRLFSRAHSHRVARPFFSSCASGRSVSNVWWTNTPASSNSQYSHSATGGTMEA